MFDPTYKDIDCPKCLRRKVYFDREIGCYCMFCGYELSVDEVLFLIERIASTVKSEPDSGQGLRTPIVEIKGRRPHAPQAERISPASESKQQNNTVPKKA